jgi:hypothetical protein
MPNAQLDRFVNALETKAVPTLVLVTLAAGLLGFLFKWLENKLVRAVRSARATKESKIGAANPATGLADVTPHCLICNSQMVKRKARRGSRAGQEFWGCLNYPQCRGTRSI